MSSTPVLIWSASGRLDPLYDGEDATLIPVSLNPASATLPLVYAPGQVLGEILAAQGVFGFYNPSLSDGTQNAKGILQYRASVTGTPGAAGNIAGVAGGVGGEWPGVTSQNTPMYKSGDFDLAKIVGLDSTGLTLLAGRLISGALGTDEVDSISVASASSGTFGITIPATTINGQAYPAVVVPNTGLQWNTSAATLVTVVNAALAAAGVPAYVTATGGVGGSAAIVVTFHGAYSKRPLLVTTDGSVLVGDTAAVTRSTPGVANYGIVRFG